MESRTMGVLGFFLTAHLMRALIREGVVGKEVIDVILGDLIQDVGRTDAPQLAKDEACNLLMELRTSCMYDLDPRMIDLGDGIR